MLIYFWLPYNNFNLCENKTLHMPYCNGSHLNLISLESSLKKKKKLFTKMFMRL